MFSDELYCDSDRGIMPTECDGVSKRNTDGADGNINLLCIPLVWNSNGADFAKLAVC
jgi:hypothetical protein